MFIKKIHIKNYRNFGDPPFQMELKPFTLILGENNVGKTNLLNALGLIFSQEIMIFRKRILQVDDLNYASVKAFKDQVMNFDIPTEKVLFPVVNVEVVLTDMDDNQEAVVGDWFANRDLTEARITYQFAPAATFDKKKWVENQRDLIKTKLGTGDNSPFFVDLPIGDYRYSIFGGDDPSNECSAYFLRMLKMEFLDALRDAQKELVASGEYRLLYRILIQKDKNKYDDIRSIIKNLDTVVRNNPNLLSIKADVEKLLDKVSLQSADIDNSIDFNFSSPEAHELLKKISMIYGANPISVERNGLGRNNLLYISLILSHLSAKEPSADDTFFRLIAIEEPEAHLHPHLQDHLAENIESIQKASGKSMQLLLTTHSTHIAAKLNLANSAIIYNDSNYFPVGHYVLSGIDQQKEKATLHYLSKYIDATKSRMFFARKIILVEGIAEQLLIPICFSLFSQKTLERVGCNIINVNGVAFSHFLKIIKNGYFIKGLVLTDSDTERTTAERAIDLKRTYDQDGLILIETSEQTTFEKDIISANRSGKGKEILLKSLRETKPQAGQCYEAGLGRADLDIDSFFSQISEYKSEFAFNLAAQLKLVNKPSDFTLPKYLQSGFQFLC